MLSQGSNPGARPQSLTFESPPCPAPSMSLILLLPRPRSQPPEPLSTALPSAPRAPPPRVCSEVRTDLHGVESASQGNPGLSGHRGGDTSTTADDTARPWGSGCDPWENEIRIPFLTLSRPLRLDDCQNRKRDLSILQYRMGRCTVT